MIDNDIALADQSSNKVAPEIPTPEKTPPAVAAPATPTATDSSAVPAAKAPAATPVKDAKPGQKDPFGIAAPAAALNMHGGANFLTSLMEVVFGKDFAEQFKDLDPVRQRAKNIISATVGDIEKLDMRGKDMATAMRETQAIIKKSLEDSVEKNGMKFDSDGEKQKFLSKVDAAFKDAVDAKTGNFNKEVFVREMAEKAKELGVDINSRFDNKAPVAATAKEPEKIPALAAKPAGENITLSTGGAATTKTLNFGDGKMAVYTVKDGHLDPNGEVTPAQFEKAVGTNYTVQTVSVSHTGADNTTSKDRVGYFIANKDTGQGYVVGPGAVKLAENPDLAKTLKNDAPKPVEPSQQPKVEGPKSTAEQDGQIVKNTIGLGIIAPVMGLGG